jgi:hypothetical protein
MAGQPVVGRRLTTRLGRLGTAATSAGPSGRYELSGRGYAAGDPVILLRFARTLENRIGWVVMLGTVVLLLGVSTGANNLRGTPM